MAGDVLTECVASFMTELCTVVESPILQIDRESSPGKDLSFATILCNFVFAPQLKVQFLPFMST